MQRRIVSVLVDVPLLLTVILPPALAVAAARLDPTLPWVSLTWLAVSAVGVGTVFSLSDFPGELLHPLALLGGTASVFLLIARVIPDAPAEATTRERLSNVVAQIVSWLRVVLAGGQATNNLLFLLLLALIAWVIGYFGAWAVFRAHSAWWPVTMSATALTLVLATFPNLFGFMLIQLVGAMLLVSRVNLEARQAIWEAIDLRQGKGLASQTFRASLALALALIALAWIAPAALASRALSQDLGQSTRPWERVQSEFNRLFGGLQAQNEASLSGFSRALTLHGSFHLANVPVLRIQSPKPEYWRAIVYDRYTGHGWLSSDPIDQATLPAGSDALRSTDQDRIELDQRVTVLAPRGSYLVGAAEPFRFDRPVSAEAYPDLPGSGIDLIAVLSTTPIEPGMQYSVASLVSDASTAELRTANQVYPPGVRQRYLSLPPIPERVYQLAVQLTAPEQNPYDKAVAVESYLRSIPYSLDLPPPPPNRDAVDYFLFDAKTGYCDYFASAMAVMLRSVGIPARVVSGYATGDRQDDGSYLVRDSNSHSWTEVYLPPYGWISFEPSGSWPRFERGSGQQSATTPTPRVRPRPVPNAAQSQDRATSTPTPTPTPPSRATNLPASRPTAHGVDLQPILPLLYLLGLLALCVLVVWFLWERGLRGLPPAAKAYAKMVRLASWLGFSPFPAETPHEYGHALSGQIPEVRSSVQRIAAEYARYRFGPPRAEQGNGILRLWRFVRNALVRRIGRLRRDR